ncbi:MAG TPA: twin-arginine translocase TatA/TatE family subunit [Chitinophagaceae bacterium]|jgi:sec-independent protein translocase protein TatA|nr:twin-arginine translocase TatA/TatE family subunit [Chitinophagaceae bacterium]
MVLLFDMPGGTEWILIILAVLVLFGGKKIPEFMRGLGRGIREFNDAKTNVKNEIEEGMKESHTASNAAPAAAAPNVAPTNSVPSPEKAHS